MYLIKNKQMKQGKREDQIRSAQLGAFIGFIGIMIICLVAVVIERVWS
tara:strand:+ start:2429 stop:2572 length:144 start_codon:yes stop_codon:yes gene_type:complete